MDLTSCPSPKRRCIILDSTMDRNSSMSKALMNPLVLTLVFRCLNLPNLKACRLVCLDWANAGASLLGKKTILNVNALFRYDGPHLFQATPVNDQLFRSITIHEEFDQIASRYKTIDIIKNGIRMLKFQNIQNLTTVIGKYAGHNENVAFQKLPLLPNLTSIKYGPSNDRLDKIYQRYAFPLVMQITINAAPNLSVLDVSGSRFPNLSGCRHLERLKFCFIRCHDTTYRDFSVAKVIRMLGQVKDSLTEVELRYNSYSFVRRQIRSIDVPVMSKLTTLTIHSFHAYLMPQLFNEEHLPALTNLSFENFMYSSSFSAHLEAWQRHRGVKSLALELCWAWSQDEFAESIAQLFPAVKKFELEMHVTRDSPIHEINQMMTPFQTWKLDEVNVDVGMVDDSSLIVAVLKNMSLWNGIKRLHFHHIRVTQNNFQPYIQDLILYHAAFKSLAFSVVTDVSQIVELAPPDSGIPINFSVAEILDKMQPIFKVD